MKCLLVRNKLKLVVNRICKKNTSRNKGIGSRNQLLFD